MLNKKNKRASFYLGIILLISVIGGVITIYTTANGPWGYTDPVDYISTAYSILHGKGIGYYEGDGQFNLTTIHPPFYSVVLSLFGLTGINLVVASRWLNIFTFIASIFISGWIFWRFSRVPILGIIASALLCSFPYMVMMFSSSYSEPLFILIFLLAGVSLLYYIKDRKPLEFILSAILCGLIPFTRYAGLAMLCAGIITISFLTTGKNWERGIRILVFSLLAFLPTILWLIWVYYIGGHSLGGRGIGLDWMTLSDPFKNVRAEIIDTIWKWIPFQGHGTLLRYRTRFILTGVALIITIVLSYFAVRKIQKLNKPINNRTDSPVLIFFGSSVIFYVGVIIITYLFTSPTIDVDNRMLLPLFVGIVMGLLGAFALWQTAWFEDRLRWLQAIPWLILILCLYWYFPQTEEQVNLYHPGAGLTAYRWNKSPTIQAVRQLSIETPIISNDWELLLLWTQRPIYGFWNTFPSVMPYQVTSYGSNNTDKVQTIFCNQRAALVIFNDFPTQVRSYLDESYISRYPLLFEGLTVYGQYSDGSIYFCNQQ